MDYVWMQFEKQKGKALYQQIHDFFVKQLLSGYWKQGDHLPSIRRCAGLLSVSLTSIKNAYAQLEEEGYIEALPRQGYFVCVSEAGVNLRKELLRSDETEQKPHFQYDFKTSAIDEASFDSLNWKRCVRFAMEQEDLLEYGEVQGETVLRKALQRHAYGYRGIACHEDQILVGASVQTLLYQLCGLLGKRKIIYMHTPPFSQAKQVFEDCGWEVHLCDVTALTQNDWEKMSFLYLHTVAFGDEKAPMPRHLRKTYCELAKRHHVYLIEDDKNGELRYVRRSESALFAADEGERVIYLSTFSKLLAPSLRIAYMILPQPLKQRYEAKKSDYNPTASKMEQLALARYLTNAHMEKHLNQLRKRYAEKYRKMAELLQRSVPHWEWVLHETALRIHVRKASVLPDEIPEEIAYDENAEEIILSFAKIDSKDIEKAFQLFADHKMTGK